MMVGYRALLWPGLLALCATLGLALVATMALLSAAESFDLAGAIDSYTLRVLRFTILQATLSTVLSLAFALPLARALARRQVFPGRRLLIRMMGLPLVLPVIVAVFGIAAVWGQNGAISNGFEALGLPGLSPLYGLTGILIAHVFFNMPLAVRLLLPVWQTIPGETWRLASQLGMGSGAILRLIEIPRLVTALPGVATLIFLLCFTSFAVVLALGGGPRSTTLEVAIYQALRLEFDLTRTVMLALMQMAVCAGIAALMFRFARPSPSNATEERHTQRPDTVSMAGRTGDAIVLVLGAAFVAGPLAAILISGVTGPLGVVLARGDVWAALLRSVSVGLGAGFLALLLGTALLITTRDMAIRGARLGRADRMELAGSLTLVMSPIVLGAGLFVLLLPLVPVFDWALPLATLVNAMVTMPYVLRVLGPVLRRTAEHHDRLCASLGMAGWSRLRHLEWPAARQAVATSLALAAALATGDLTAIALFGTEREATLALLLYRALGSYRMDEAAVLALLLVMTCLAVFVVVEGVVGGRSRT
ncbi:MAG: thiamine/thiamine pyrophosphate ABC transporter, permease protein [Rhodospirillaceae bacterium]|jgi:thiamine transport system permease protein|nr:thiamine/thiamine pyrophosphate ABC transporter, permease protein [Rhodospirillaceae bacterium]MBT6512426.1 thiamine/thiamine pyrophosphate ABC transporter, permease protein [Rhodospirillaceae bacterium]